MLLAWFALPAFAGEVEGTASGFVELRNLWYAGVDGTPWLLVERFRPTFEAELSKRVHLETTLEVGLQQGRFLQDEFNRTIEESPLATAEVIDGETALELGSCELVEDGSKNGLFHIDGIDDYARVDRLFADIYLGKADVRVGRQAVQWGNALLVHPADPFPEVLFLEPWRPRAGVNAARLNWQLGEASALTLLGGADDALVDPRAAARLTTNFLETDVSLIGAWRAATVEDAAGDTTRADTGIVGLDVKGTLEVGFWLEGSWHLQTGAEGYAEVATGLDYSFPVLDQFVFGAQYYYNGAGEVEPNPLAGASRFAGAVQPPICPDLSIPILQAAPTTADPFAPVFVGMHYAMVYTAIAVNEKWSGNAALVQNVGDGTGVGVPTISFKPAGWSEISLSAQLPYKAWGDGGELSPSRDDLVPDVPIIGTETLPFDLNGMVPDATVIVWTRASF